MKKITIPEIIRRMMAETESSIKDTDHFLRVWTYANCVGGLEGLDPETQFILEAAAITHDIACPLCRKKYGKADEELQEKEGDAVVRKFFADSGLSEAELDRIAYLVSHHHSYDKIDGIDFQILVEADFIANAVEKGYDSETVRNFRDTVMKTPSGKQILSELFSKV